MPKLPPKDEIEFRILALVEENNRKIRAKGEGATEALRANQIYRAAYQGLRDGASLKQVVTFYGEPLYDFFEPAVLKQWGITR